MSERLAAAGRRRPRRQLLRARGVPAPGLGDDGGVRVGLSAYTSDDDVDRLLAALRAALSR